MQRTRPLPSLLRGLLLALFLCTLPGTGEVHAEGNSAGGGEPRTEMHYTFAQAATFTFTLPAGETAREVTLYLRINDADTESYTLPIDEGHATYRRDLRAEPFPPFATLTYWWSYPAAEGMRETSRKTILYEDNRFPWNAREEDGITVKWVEALADEADRPINAALDIARQAREEIGSRLQSPSLEPITLYIYPSLADLQLALRLSGESWVGGEARPEVGVILLAIPLTETGILQMQRDIPHEMTHLLLYRQLGKEGYQALPAWLNEGLATVFEQRPDPAYAVTLDKAIASGSIIHLEQLCRTFYTLPDDRVRLAYAESGSIVTYIRQTYGWSAIRSLLAAYGDGHDCQSGVEQVLGMDLGELERSWLKWVGASQSSATAVPASGGTTLVLRVLLLQLAPWLALLVILVLPLALSLLHRPLLR